MKARRLEDVFEECLTAYLEKGRSVEESLSLYPALASQLEPLLRTAVSVSQTLEASGPPWHAIERGRNRFLANARAYATGKALLRGSQPRHATPWGRMQWSVLGGAVAAMAAVVVVGAIMVGGGSGSSGSDDPGLVENPSPTAKAVPPAVREMLEGFRSVNDHAAVTVTEQGTLTAEDVDALTVYAVQIQEPGTLDALDDAARADLQTQIQQTIETLQQLPPEQQQAENVIGLLSLMGDLLLQLSTTPTPAPVTPTPSGPTDTPAPTDAPVTTPAPTAAPTDAPISTPAPATDTPAPTQDSGPQATPEPTPVFRLFGF